MHIRRRERPARDHKQKPYNKKNDRKDKFYEKEGAYFISFATVFWVDLFTRLEYFDIMINSLDYCRKNTGMIIFGYCIMPSHDHLLFRSADGKPPELMRDFKGFYSKKTDFSC